jgi:hypothetical protein
VEREVNPVSFKGPRDRKALWAAQDAEGNRIYADQRLVGINAARTLRTRPLFREWSCEFMVRVLDGAVNLSDFESALDAAQTIGILDGRPIYAGQFTTTSLEETKNAA